MTVVLYSDRTHGIRVVTGEVAGLTAAIIFSTGVTQTLHDIFLAFLSGRF